MDIQKDSDAIKSFFLKYDRILIKKLLKEMGIVTMHYDTEQRKKFVKNISRHFISTQNEMKVYNAKVYEMALANILDDTEEALDRYGDDESETNWKEYYQDIASLIWEN